jgi:ribonuclease P protein component
MSVDESPGTVSPTAAADAALWLAVLVPKRHACRAVTRSMLKREMRAGVARQAHALAPGLWLLRLRSPFNTSSFPSAASSALREAARAEIDTLLADAGHRHASH